MSESPEPRVRITLPDGWDARLRAFSITPEQRTLREQLGLPTDRPVVMTGHQASIWHAGILAKYIAADEIARRFNGAQARLVVDQDDNDPFTLRVPVLDEQGVTRVQTIRLGPEVRAGVPTGSVPASLLPALPELRWALPSVGEGVHRIHAAVAAHTDAPSAAAQVGAALDELMKPDAGDGVTVMASAMAGTGIFAELVDRMRRDPVQVAESYNDATAMFPDAGVKPLAVDAGRVELPLWRIAPGAPRAAVWSDAMPAMDQLAPKALLMTGLLRLGACDLFIHGTGGLVYDRITERWLRNWLGDEAKGLAPMIGVSADVYLPLPHGDFTAESAARAKWLAHSARHNPVLIGDDSLHRTKLAMVRAIEMSGATRAEKYRELHALLGSHRRTHADELGKLDADAKRADALIEAGELARDRTWAFPLHSEGALRDLSERVRATIVTH